MPRSSFATTAWLPILALLLLALSLNAEAAYTEPPERVARLSYLDGEVSFSPAGEREWYRAQRNRPHVRGDRFWTDRRARLELELGTAAIRLDQLSSATLLDLDDRIAQVELNEGTLNLRVRRLYRDQEYEIATPTLALVVTQPGEFRIDVDPRGEWTEIVVWDGEAVAYGERGRFALRDGDAVRFYDTSLRDYEFLDLPRPDSFDRFCLDRNARMDRAVSLRYVPDDLIGYYELDEYGSWSTHREYGAVWFPTRVDAGWAPYRYGRWIWQDPWGWTWIDDAPWGFAPFHYGRWASIGGRWGWVPSPRTHRPVYSPALVAFYGDGDWRRGYGRNRPVGWFPLGPRDAYLPGYSVNRDRFNRLNAWGRGDDPRVRGWYDDYSRGRSGRGIDYAYRANPDAVTLVPGDVFQNARPVRGAALRLERDTSARAQASHIAAMAPVARSQSGDAAPVNVPARDTARREVIAVSRPPAPVVPFASRREALERTPGRPMDADTFNRVQSRGRDPGPDPRVRVVTENSAEVPRDTNRRGTAERSQRGAAPPQAGSRGRDGQPPATNPRGSAVDEARRQREVELDAQRQRDADLQRQQAAEAARSREAGSRGRDQELRRAEPFERERESAEPVQRQEEAQRTRDDDQRQREEADFRRQRENEQFQRQRQAEQQQQQQQQQQAEQAQRESERQERDRELRQRQADEAQREDTRRREADDARRASESRQRDAEQAQREAERAQQQREQEQRQREAEQEQRQREAEQAQAQREQAQREHESRRREAEQAQREQAQREAEAQREREQAEREAERERERQSREAEQEERARVREAIQERESDEDQEERRPRGRNPQG